MKTTHKKLLRRIPEATFWSILFYLPFHAFITTWIIASTGDALIIKALKDVVVLLLVVICAAIGFQKPNLRRQLLSRKVNWLILTYTLLSLLYFYLSPASQTARTYALLVNTRYLLFFVAAQVIGVIGTKSIKKVERRIENYVIYTVAITSVFGLVQIHASKDLMTHFGYSVNTISPVFTLDSQPDIRRASSTLRGPNPFGTFLVLGSALLASFMVKAKSTQRRVVVSAVLLVSLIALYFTYSRSSWVALVVAGIVFAVVAFAKLNKKVVLFSGLALVLLVAAAILFVDKSPYLQRTLLHRDVRNSSKIAKSDEIHLSSIQLALDRIKVRPMGCYLGCSGPATYYNPVLPVNLPENYYLQIAQEVGVFGLFLLLVIFLLAAYELLKLRHEVTALILLAVFAGINVAGLFSHVWTDDTIAYLWWGLAGLVIGLYNRSDSATASATHLHTSERGS